MHQFKKSSSLKKPGSKLIEPPQQLGGKKNIVKQIDKLQKQIESANEDIKKTQKMLDVDLFLKQQKQKRLEYAKQINADYQQQKRIREQKLYKKFREDKGSKKEKQPATENQPIQFQSLNIPVLSPLNIVKSFLYMRSENDWVKDGHHYKPDDLKTEGLRENEQKIFENWYKNPQQKQKYDGDLESKHIVWKNIKQVAENALQMKTLPTQIQQNSLIPNDADSQNILSALTLMKPQICKEAFSENDEIFISQLYAPDSEVTVVIDKQVLVRQFTHKYVNLGSRSQNPNVLWPTLIEKAFNKLKISKNVRHLSNSLCKTIYTFYGIDPEIIAISNKNVIKQNFYLVLGHLLQEGSVGFMNLNGHSTKSYENRLYLLQSVQEHVEKKGKEEKKQIYFKIKNPWRGKLIDNQNINKFTLLQLLEIFNCLVLLRGYPTKWCCFRINFSYFSNGAISITSNQWTKNPQYLFSLTKKSVIRIVLRKSGQIGQEKQGVYGFLLFENKEASNKIEAMKMDWLITKTKSVDTCEAIYCCELAKGNYIVIPYCTDQSTKEYQFYVLDFFVEKESCIEFGKARIFDYNYVEKKGTRLNNDTKIIQSLQSTQKFEKPKVQKFNIPSPFKSVITEKILQSLNLNLFKNSQLSNFFVPGQISNLLINKQIEIELKQNKNVLNSKQTQHTQLAQEEQAQNLTILLGYDAVSDEINQGLMKDYIEQSVGIYDFRDYGLGEQGLTAVLEALALHPQIIELDLSGNDLNDFAITFLCYYLEKGNRTEARRLDVSKNRYGKIGKNALEGLKSTFPKLVIIG